MPHLQFYATPEDLTEVLRFIFDENEVQVFESYSEFESPLREFKGTLAVIDALRQRDDSRIGLSLYAESMGGPYQIERLRLKDGPLTGGARWREKIAGWGLIQLDLHGPRGNVLHECYTNHNTLKRALSWCDTHAELRPPMLWDFKEVTRISRRINRRIRDRLGVRKLGSTAVLPGAATAFTSGMLRPANNYHSSLLNEGASRDK